MSFVVALKAEIANLQAELERSLTYIRLQEARRMLALYEKDQPAEENKRSIRENALAQLARAAKPYNLDQALSPNQPSPFSVRRGSPERARALEAARLFLFNRVDEPTPTAAIYDHITQLGIEIGGNDPRNNLSAMLSNSPIFQSHGRAGWTLASAEDSQAPDPDLLREEAIVREAEEATTEDVSPPEQSAPSRSVLDT